MDEYKPSGPNLHRQGVGQGANFKQPSTENSNLAERPPIDLPQISLPQGGGAIKGIDEKFRVNPSNGTAGFSLPIPMTASRNGFMPALSLGYNSGSGNSAFGMGWSLNFPKIQRKTEKELPKYLDQANSDTFIYSESEDLVPFLNEAGGWTPETTDTGTYLIERFRPRLEGGFARIERVTNQINRQMWWKVTSRDNVTTFYGLTPDARIADPEHTERIFTWLPQLSYDDKGNWVQYTFKPEDLDNVTWSPQEHKRLNQEVPITNAYLKSVRYGNRTPFQPSDPYEPSLPNPQESTCFQIVFDYGEHDNDIPSPTEIQSWSVRNDPFSSYRSGFEIRTYRLCRRVLLFHSFPDLGQTPCLVRSLDLTYGEVEEHLPDQTSNHSPRINHLLSAADTGYIRRPDQTYASRSLPPVEFTYQALNWSREVQNVDPDSLVHAPTGLNQGYRWTDLYSEGIPGILSEHSGGWYFKENLGVIDGKLHFTPAQIVAKKPSFEGLQAGYLSLQDLESNGEKQLVTHAPDRPGYFKIGPDKDVKAFSPFPNFPTVDLKDPSLRMIDLNGDGRSEIVISDQGAFVWYENHGKEGFGKAYHQVISWDEEEGPAVIFSDPDTQEAILLADMSGDGLSDIVRVRNGSICYWPNLGFGRFGAKIAMGNSPIFEQNDFFDPNRLIFTGLAGSGATDLLYYGSEGIDIYLNQSGNAWSAPISLGHVFPIHQGAKITVNDLLGNGTPCLVWSDPHPDTTYPMRYVDLFQGNRPHLMIGIRNNQGKYTQIQYKSSTFYYLQDKLAGNHWVTKLPFPVLVVSRMEVEDKIGELRFATEYKYAHGYYDATEREFRGFGKVEQLDSEEYQVWSVNQAGTHLETSETHFQAPVLSRSWFHTGAFLHRENILDQFAHEYWPAAFARQFPAEPLTVNEPVLADASILPAPHLIDQTITNNLSVGEWQEALRSCKGMMLRQEVFALDGNAEDPDSLLLAAKPYEVVQHNCLIHLLQPRTGQKHAVYMLQEQEAVEIQYERNETDPRISHQFNLEFNELGQVRKSAAIVYPRQVSDPSLPLSVQGKQASIHIHLQLAGYSNDVINDHTYRLRTPVEGRTFEITGLTPAGNWFQAQELQDLDTIGSNEIAFEAIPDPLQVQRRLIQHSRNLFFNDTLDGPLPQGQLGSFGIPFETYQLIYTDALVQDLFGAKIPNIPALMAEGHYHLMDNAWWGRSGNVTLVDTVGGETAADARDRFFVPLSFTNPAGDTTTFTYHPDAFLLVESETDALGNQQAVEVFNFRTLNPTRVRDINHNINEVVLDELGMVKAMALIGQGGEGDNLTGLEEITGPAEQALIDTYFSQTTTTDLRNTAGQLLQGATARFFYDLERYRASEQEQETALTNDPDLSPCALPPLRPQVHGIIIREQHQQASPLQLSFAYSDGMGNVILDKAQAEPGEALELILQNDYQFQLNTVDTSLTGDMRWIGNGRTIYNNKGNPVRTYEPFFSVTPHYEDGKALVERGIFSQSYYDAPGRLIRVEQPDGTLQRVDFNAWSSSVWDANDTVLESQWYQDRGSPIPTDPEPIGLEASAAWKAAQHQGTAKQSHYDNLGREVYTLAHNRLNQIDEFYATHSNFNSQGQILSVVDARGNQIMSYRYNIAGQLVFQQSPESGERWEFSNVLGPSIRRWDSRDQVFRMQYDELQRRTHLFVQAGMQPEILLERTIYGEAHPQATQLNLRGALLRQYDGAGAMTITQRDFKGNTLESNRQFAIEYRNAVDWSPLAALNDLAQIDLAAVPLLEPEVFVNAANFDALNRQVEVTHADQSSSFLLFNEAGALSQVSVQLPGELTPTTTISEINYNAFGQRTQVVYQASPGNTFSTQLSYNTLNRRLQQFTTRRHVDNHILQDLNYTYDAAGNITAIQDLAQTSVIFNNLTVGADQTFAYDALYQLIRSEGREHAAQNNLQPNENGFQPVIAVPFPNSPEALQRYIQEFTYDEVGNLTRMQHQGGNVLRWTRHYQYAAGHNQLTGTSLPGDLEGQFSASYAYDNHGNMISMPHLPLMEWDHYNRLHATSQQVVNNGTPETTYYVYDSAGQRVRKVTDRQAGQGQTPTRREERIYLGPYERFRTYANDGTTIDLERESLFLLDDLGRMGRIDRLNIGNDGGPAETRRYLLNNHLGSAVMEVDEQVNVISYEEYHAYGTTAYRAGTSQLEVNRNRYRYTGKEIDSETGFGFHGARYYASWLGRWTAADPIGLGDGINRYGYVHGNPIRLIAPTGTKGQVYHEGAIISEKQFEAVVNREDSLAPGTIAMKLNGGQGEHLVMPTRVLMYDAHNQEGADSKHAVYTIRSSEWSKKHVIASMKVEEKRRNEWAAKRILASKKMITAVAVTGVITATTGGVATAIGATSTAGVIAVGAGEGLFSSGLTSGFLTWMDGGSTEEILTNAAVDGGLGALGGGLFSTLGVGIGQLRGPSYRTLSEARRGLELPRPQMRGGRPAPNAAANQIKSPPDPNSIHRPAMTGNKYDEIWAGHGLMVKGRTFTVPEGTWIEFSAPINRGIDNPIALKIEETGINTGHSVIYGPGMKAPEHILTSAGKGMQRLEVGAGASTVDAPTLLSDLIEPNSGLVLFNACRYYAKIF